MKIMLLTLLALIASAGVADGADGRAVDNFGAGAPLKRAASVTGMWLRNGARRP